MKLEVFCFKKNVGSTKFFLLFIDVLKKVLFLLPDIFTTIFSYEKSKIFKTQQKGFNFCQKILVCGTNN